MNAVLIAPGPSFQPSDIDDLRRLGPLYTVNRAIRHWNGRDDAPNGAFFLESANAFEDERAVWSRDGLQRIVGKDCPDWDEEGPISRFDIVPRQPPIDDPWQEPEVIVGPPFFVIPAAYQYLVKKLGVKRLFLIGCDGHAQNGVYGFKYDSLSVDQMFAKETSYATSAEAVVRWAAAGKPWLKTINLSSKSSLAAHLPTMSVAKAVGQFCH